MTKTFPIRRACLVAATALIALIPANAAITQNHTDFLNQMYADLLHRPVDSPSLARVQALFAAGASRGQITAAVTDSTEFRALQVEGYYQTIYNVLQPPRNLLSP